MSPSHTGNGSSTPPHEKDQNRRASDGPTDDERLRQVFKSYSMASGGNEDGQEGVIRSMDARRRAIDVRSPSLPGRLSNDDPRSALHRSAKTKAPHAPSHNFHAAGAVRCLAGWLAGNGDPGALREIVLRHHLEKVQVGIDPNAPRNERARQDARVLEQLHTGLCANFLPTVRHISSGGSEGIADVHHG